MNTKPDDDLIPAPDFYIQIRKQELARKQREEDEKEKMEAELKQKKIKKHVEDLSRDLATQLRRGIESPIVTLPHRHSNLIEPIARDLKQIFEEKGYRCHFDIDPCLRDQRWTDEGWHTVFISDPKKEPYFQLG